MKKFLIALLAIAVLFSFAACDNNSSSPDQGGTTLGPNDTYNKAAASIVDELIKGTGSNGVKDLLGKSTTLLTDGKYNADYTSFTVEATLAEGFLNESDTTATLVVTGKQASGFDAKAGGTINLERYTLTFTAPATDIATGNDSTATGSVSGYVNGTIVVKIDAEGKASEFTPSVSRVFYPDTADITYAGVDVEPEDFTSYLTKDAEYDGSQDLTTVAKYDEYLDDSYQTEIAGFVTALLDKTNGIPAQTLTDIAAENGKQYAGAEDKLGIATFTINGSEDAPVKIAADSTGSKYIYLGKDQSLTLKLSEVAPADSSTSIDSSASFAAGSFELSGSFGVYTAWADVNTNTVNDNFTAVDVVLSGSCTATVTGTNADGVTAITDLEFTESTLVGTAKASVVALDGPELGADNELAAFGPVTKEYKVEA